MKVIILKLKTEEQNAELTELKEIRTIFIILFHMTH